MNQIVKMYSVCLLLVLTGCSSDKESAASEPGAKEKAPSTSWTTENRDDALENCVNSGNDLKYCSCSVDILTSLFTYDEFKSFDAQIRSGVQPRPEVKSKMMVMGKRALEECLKKP